MNNLEDIRKQDRKDNLYYMHIKFCFYNQIDRKDHLQYENVEFCFVLSTVKIGILFDVANLDSL